MKAIAIQDDIAWESKGANRSSFEARVRAASPPPGSLVVLPELCDVGFTMDATRAAADDSRAWASVLARSLGVWLISGLAVRHESGVSNCAVVHDPRGDEAAIYRKTFLFTPAGEPQHYVAGEGAVTVDCGGLRVAPMICYDLRFPELWRRAAVIGCNRTGTDPNAAYTGGSAIISPLGDVLAHAGAGPGTASADIDGATVTQWRAKFPALADARPDIGIARR